MVQENFGLKWNLTVSSPHAASHWLPALIAGRRSASLPNNRINSSQGIAFITAMDQAKNIIKIQTPNLNDDAAKAAILRALARGVMVQIILTKNHNEREMSLPGMGGGNLKNAEGLVEASGRNLKLLDIRYYTHAAGQGPVEQIPPKRPLSSHAKYMSVDNQVLIMGSANMDTLSWNQIREVIVVIDNALTTKNFDSVIFDKNFKIANQVCRMKDRLICG